jgi:DNA modification methylase
VILQGDALAGLRTLADATVQTCVTSPPYFGLRDYGAAGQIGLESTPEAYVGRLVEVFREVRRVLKLDGTLWLNLGDSYANDTKWGGSTGGKHSGALHGHPVGRARRSTGLKSKDLIGVPWRVAFALQADGWYLRQDIIWAKPNPMPESVRDRCTKAHEYVFLLAKSKRYFYDAAAVGETATNRPSGNKARKLADGSECRLNTHLGRGVPYVASETRNRRSVWTITPKPYKGAHFAVMPEALVTPCILAGSRPGDLVLDPFAGAGTVAVVARRLARSFVGMELKAEYCALAERRLA